MATLYRMHYDSNDYRFLVGNEMIVSNPKEWEEKVFEWVIAHYQKFLTEYKNDEGEPYTKEAFEKWVKWCLRETVYTDPIEIDDYHNWKW